MMLINDLSGVRFFGLPFLYIGNLDVKIFHSVCHRESLLSKMMDLCGGGAKSGLHEPVELVYSDRFLRIQFKEKKD
jgi:hypothetical protein